MADGWPHLEPLFVALSEQEMPPELQLISMNMIGRYLHTLRAGVSDHDLDLLTAHAVATSAVMGDPVVASFIQSNLEGMMASVVGSVVQNG